MGKYESTGREAIQEGTLEYSENSQELPVKYALTVLDDAKSMILQLIGI